jgi:hypothetical protein
VIRIDRVTAEMDLVPAGGQGAAPTDGAAALSDPRTLERIKELVRQALAEHLRELERRGVV